MERHRRSIAKVASYRLLATSIVFAMALIYTAHAGSAAKIGVTAAIAKTALYYFRERVWTNIRWGTTGH